MIRLSIMLRATRALVFTNFPGMAVFALVASIFASGVLQAQTAAPQADAASVANNPDVLGAERLFPRGLRGRLRIEDCRASPSAW